MFRINKTFTDTNPWSSIAVRLALFSVLNKVLYDILMLMWLLTCGAEEKKW